MFQCAQLRKSLGVWQDFNVSYAERCAAPELVVCVVGVAVFAKTRKEVSLVWLLENQTAHLFQIAVQQDPDHWMQIPSGQEKQRLIDPPRHPFGRGEG